MLADGAACVSVHEERDTFVAVTSASNGEPMAADEDATGTSPGAYRRFQNWGSRQARRVRGAQRRFRLEIVVLLLIAMLFIGLGWRGQVAQGLDWTWSMVDASEGRLRIVAGFGVFLTALVAYRTYRRDQSWKRTQWAIDQLVDSYSGDTEEDPVADLKKTDTSVHESGATAEELGKEGAVDRETKSATVAASFTTRDHDVIRAWAESRGGTPADVEGTGNGGGAGVLRIEFRDEGDRLEDVGWEAFFATFDDSDVDFLYQERTSDGSVSRFHKFVRSDG